MKKGLYLCKSVIKGKLVNIQTCVYDVKNGFMV
jgi:hypothetical protein